MGGRNLTHNKERYEACAAGVQWQTWERTAAVAPLDVGGGRREEEPGAEEGLEREDFGVEAARCSAASLTTLALSMTGLRAM